MMGQQTLPPQPLVASQHQLHPYLVHPNDLNPTLPPWAPRTPYSQPLPTSSSSGTPHFGQAEQHDHQYHYQQEQHHAQQHYQQPPLQPHWWWCFPPPYPQVKATPSQDQIITQPSPPVVHGETLVSMEPTPQMFLPLPSAAATATINAAALSIDAVAVNYPGTTPSFPQVSINVPIALPADQAPSLCGSDTLPQPSVLNQPLSTTTPIEGGAIIKAMNFSPSKLPAQVSTPEFAKEPLALHQDQHQHLQQQPLQLQEDALAKEKEQKHQQQKKTDERSKRKEKEMDLLPESSMKPSTASMSLSSSQNAISSDHSMMPPPLRRPARPCGAGTLRGVTDRRH